jgi:CRISPR-associated protein Csx10
LNAYPAGRGEQRALPLPASWRWEKNTRLEDKPEAFDFALSDHAQPDNPDRVKLDFCLSDEDGLLEVFNTQQIINIHIGSERRGEVRKGESTVFRYQALAAGQIFAALVVADRADDLNNIHRLIEEHLQATLGGSRSAGYGQVTLSVKSWPEDEAPFGETDEVITLTLLSDALLLNADGQPTLNLSEALSATLQRTIEHKQAFVNPARVGGFNRQWRLPLPQPNAAGMGSVFVYEAATFSEAELQRLAEHGIGQRRVDGFGRLAVNWPGRSEVRLRERIPSQKRLPPKALAADSKALARDMAQRLLRAELDEQLRRKVSQISIDSKHAPRNHQLSRLRLAVRRALLTEDRFFEEVQYYLRDMKDAARQQFYRARMTVPGRSDSERLLAWLEARLKDEGDGLKQIGAEYHVESVAGEQSMIDARLRREYTLRLIDGVLHRAMKDNRGQEERA